jgi:hypothetical protein
MRTIREFRNQEHKRGAALMTLMIIVLLVAGTGAYLVNDAKQQLFAVTRVRDYLKAQAYAEGGANQAYSLLKTNFALRTSSGSFPMTAYGDGVYDVTVTSVGSNKASISCIGERGEAAANVMLDIQNFAAGTGGTTTSGVPPAVGVYTYGIVSGGQIWLRGNGTLNMGTGKAHANAVYDHSGTKFIIGNISSSAGITMSGNAKVTGNAAAPSISAAAGKITGTRTVAPVPLVTIPNIDLTPYYNVALANGQVYGTPSVPVTKAVSASPPGGVIWVNGTMSISGGGALVGSFIATGDITSSAGGSIRKANNYPLLVSRDGNITVSSVATLQGLIYAKTGTFRKTGNGIVQGTIIANAGVEGAGGWDYMSYENSTPVAPVSGGGGGSAASDGSRVGVIAWQK